MDRALAAEELAQVFYRTGIQGSMTAFFEMLQDLPGASPDKLQWEQSQNWISSLPEDKQALFRFLIQEAMIMTAFGLAVHFDGDAVGYDMIGGHIVEYAIRAKIYKDTDQVEAGNPIEVIEICPTRNGDDIHDLFLDIVDKNK